MRISFIGGGVMAEAMLAGILDAGVASPSDVGIGEPVEDRRTYLAEKYGVAAHAGNSDAMKDADIVILAVKPQSLPDVMADICGELDGKQTVLSIMAGIRMETLAEGLGHAAIIRVIPNTPAQIRAGMSVWTASEAVPADMVAASREILSTVGEELYVADEKLIDMATALMSSGPAYVFLFIEALIDAGVYLGVSRDVSRKMVLQMVSGSTRMVAETGRHPAELKDMVTSPGGTTAEALLTFDRGGFRGVVIDAVAAAYEKSLALGGPS
jgi:pyrroline-5-carboxylate reductase